MKVLCKKTCIASDMGLGYCFAGKIYQVGPKVVINHHFEKLRSPKAEIEELKKSKKKSPVDKLPEAESDPPKEKAKE